MNTTFCTPSCKLETFFVQSEIDSVAWSKTKVYAGFITGFEVNISNFDQWTLMKTSCWTEDGQLLDTKEGFVNRSQYHGKVYIPDSISPNTRIHLIVELPEHNISYTSDSVCVRTSLTIQ